MQRECFLWVVKGLRKSDMEWSILVRTYTEKRSTQREREREEEGLLWKLCQRCDAPAGQDWGATAWRVILPRSTSKLVNSANTILYSTGSLLKRLSEPRIKLSLRATRTLALLRRRPYIYKLVLATEILNFQLKVRGTPNFAAERKTAHDLLTLFIAATLWLRLNFQFDDIYYNLPYINWRKRGEKKPPAPTE